MAPTPTPGNEPPSTLMGPGWRPRTRSHAEDIGTVWAACGCDDEVSLLRGVLLTWPGDELAYDGEPADFLMSERPDLSQMRAEALAIAAFYEARGAAVTWIRPTSKAPPNLVFACDLFFMTPQGAVISRMAAVQRAGEERWVTAALAGAGIPILATIVGEGTLEGADALWLRPDLVLVGVGRRTNQAGFEQLRGVLGNQGVQALAVEIPGTVQHLLGAMNLLDADRAVTWGATASMNAALATAGVESIVFEDNPEVVGGRALNFVAVGPNEIVMPAGNPNTRSRLEAAGVRCWELEIPNYLKAEGGLGCLTGILRRG